MISDRFTKKGSKTSANDCIAIVRGKIEAAIREQTYMSHERITLQPNLRRLLELEALSEAQVIYGDHLLDKQISQVTAQIYGGQREGTLAVLRADTLAQQEISSFKGMSGLILIKPVQSSSGTGKSVVRSQVVSEIELEPIVKLCTEASTPLIVLPSLEDSREIAEEIRAAYLSEVKKASSRLHTSFIRIVIEEGLDAFVLQLSEVLGRPVAVETADFKLISAENMGQTPVNQQKTISEEIGEALNRELRSSSFEDPDTTLEVVRVGRRLVAAIILEGAVVGYLSVMLRPTDDEDLIGEYLRPAVLAVLVDFSQRRREFISAGSVGHKSLLKDLLSGHSLAASDQERLYQYFGLDICDGSLVFAVRLIPDNLARSLSWTEERQAMVEMEGAQVFVVPYENKQERSWKDYAEDLKESIRKKVDGLKIQIGAGRMAESLLDVADSYREARQALITGSMIHSDEEFVIGYSELGIKRILYLVIDHPELERFYEEHLAPLESYDSEWETELVPTLRVYLEQGYNLNSAAKELFIHRHTMRYRLEQIAELLKVDIDAPEVLLNLQIAFKILEMKGKSKT